MPLGSQPRRADGTVEHPYSALRLRLGLALFGLVVSVVGAIVLWNVGAVPVAIALIVLAAIALVDAVVVTLRLRRGRRPT
jgi:ABC-type proline/glycine betaine transport system permease subunit